MCIKFLIVKLDQKTLLWRQNDKKTLTQTESCYFRFNRYATTTTATNNNKLIKVFLGGARFWGGSNVEEN